MVLADAIDEETGRRDPGLAADDPQAPGRARREGRVRPQGRLGVRVLRPQGLLGGPRRARLARPADVRPLQRGLPPAPGHEGRAAASAAAQPDDRGERADRVQQGRGRERPARGQHPLRPRPRVGRPERGLQARRQGDRLPQRLGHHLHGQARPPLDGLVRTPPHEPLGRRQGRAAHGRGRRRAGRAVRPLGDRPALRGRDDGSCRASWPSSSRRSSTRTSATRRCRGRRSTSSGAATTARPASASSVAVRRSTSRTASRAAT